MRAQATKKKRKQGTSRIANGSPDDVSSSELETSVPFEADGTGIELVFGLVAPTGVDLGRVFESLRGQLKTLNYSVEVIRLSELITPYLTGKAGRFQSEYDRIRTLMEDGSTLREQTQQRDIVGRLGIAKIRALRKALTGKDYKAADRVAYIVSSFKRPEEVDLYRQVYGKAFTLISVYAPRQSRIDDLARRLGPSLAKPGKAKELAVQLVERDHEEEGRKLGQRVGRTFPLADYFLTVDSKSELDRHLMRLVQLSFGHPYISPSRDEQGMFFAQAAALRSLDLSRQVGAAIVDADGAILTTGCNEVPKFGGGLYWGEDKNVYRDFEVGHDANVTIKAEILEDALVHLRDRHWLDTKEASGTSRELVAQALFQDDAFLKNSLMFDVIEFGRAVHAEAAAISEAARRGVALSRARLFCTTYPCHICARHILASGISEVVFIEPYEKSRTGQLYSDSVSVEPQEASNSKANFKAFVGVAPRRYMDFFQMVAPRKKVNGKVLEMDEIADEPRIRRIVLTYLAIEDIIIRDTVPIQHQSS